MELLIQLSQFQRVIH